MSSLSLENEANTPEISEKCVLQVMVPLLGMRLYEPVAAVAVALLVAVLAVRALGQTDLNPVSGVGKLSQVSTCVLSC